MIVNYLSHGYGSRSTEVTVISVREITYYTTLLKLNNNSLNVIEL